MRINRIIDNRYGIFDDKDFVRKFTLLLGLIIATSLFLIYHSLHQVSHLSLSSMQFSKEVPLSLGTVEKELNGNVISLEVLEGDFQDLAERDLQELDTLERQAATRQSSQSTVPAASTNKRPVIEITSVEIRDKAPRSKSLKWLKKKFYATHNAKYALDIAKRFYSLGKYERALKWSLIANEVDQKRPESWIMFAKTKMKMGKKQDAINVLNAYLKTYSSVKVSRYLEKIKS